MQSRRNLAWVTTATALPIFIVFTLDVSFGFSFGANGLKIQGNFHPQRLLTSLSSSSWSSSSVAFTETEKSTDNVLRCERRKLFTLWKQGTPSNKRQDVSEQRLRFNYEYDILRLPSTSTSPSTPTTGVVLIHPIGVGISRWYFNRLFDAFGLKHKEQEEVKDNLLILAPDLIGSGSACNPVQDSGEYLQRLPLFNISDWSDQILDLMSNTQEEMQIDNWCLVANGGCSPIALQVAQRCVEQGMSPPKKNVTNVILSAPPRLPFFTRTADAEKVQKSYRTLSGVPGNLFWWYALRKNGAFIRKFSEKNLVGNPDSLGEQWTPNCVTTAKLHGGKSRYSTFAFLAGTLQDGCTESLNVLKNKGNVNIDFIRGGDKRTNRAKSWFWQRPRKKKNTPASTEARETIQQLVNKNGNRGDEVTIGGRISLAWEDGEGYCQALLALLSRV